jgi:hypothetical protein
MKRLLLLCLIAPLTACLSSGLNLNLLGDNVRMTPEHAQTIKTAGVISFVEPQPRIHFVSSSMQESNLKPANLNDWDARATITGLMEERLRQKGFTVVPIDPKMTVKEAYSSSASFAEPERIRAQLSAIGKAYNVDMLVVVYRQQVRDFVGDSSQKVISYGLYKRHAESEVYAYSAVYIEALNVNKGYVLGKSDGEVKVKLAPEAWEDKFESGDGPFRLNAARDEVIKALTSSTMIAAQEAGLSN